jgi:CDP-diacylglycerol pyrophosphatase
MEKLSIAISQTDEDQFNLVINKTSIIEGNEPVSESIIKSGIGLLEVKELINAL